MWDTQEALNEGAGGAKEGSTFTNLRKWATNTELVEGHCLRIRESYPYPLGL